MTCPVNLQILEMVRAGLSPSFIAKKLGIGLRAVSSRIYEARRAGLLPVFEVPKRPGARNPKAAWERLYSDLRRQHEQERENPIRAEIWSRRE